MRDERGTASRKASAAFGDMFSKEKEGAAGSGSGKGKGGKDERADDDDYENVHNRYSERVANIKETDEFDQRLKDAEMLRDLYIRNGKRDDAMKLDMQIKH